MVGSSACFTRLLSAVDFCGGICERGPCPVATRLGGPGKRHGTDGATNSSAPSVLCSQLPLDVLGRSQSCFHQERSRSRSARPPDCSGRFVPRRFCDQQDMSLHTATGRSLP